MSSHGSTNRASRLGVSQLGLVTRIAISDPRVKRNLRTCAIGVVRNPLFAEVRLVVGPKGLSIKSMGWYDNPTAVVHPALAEQIHPLLRLSVAMKKYPLVARSRSPLVAN